jgi:hypothetical protein
MSNRGARRGRPAEGALRSSPGRSRGLRLSRRRSHRLPVRRAACRQQQRERAGDQDERSRCPQARFQASPFVHRAREHRARKPPESICHVIEADAHRDLVVGGIGEDQVGVDCRVHREDDAEGDQADDDRDCPVAAGPSAMTIAAGHSASTSESRRALRPSGTARSSLARLRTKRGAAAWTAP